jgi:hypothetical protein
MTMHVSKSWLSVCLTVTAGLVGGAIAGSLWSLDASAAARKGKTVAAERFVLVDASGRQRAALQVLPNGRVDLSMKDAKGGDSVKIGVEANGSASIGFFTPAGQRVAMLGQGSEGHTELLLASPEGKGLARLASTPNRESALTLYDTKTGRARAGLGVAATGEPALVLLDHNGRARAELSLTAKGTPGLALVDEQGKPVAGVATVQEPTSSPR